MTNDAPISEKKYDLLDRYDFAQEIVIGQIKTFQNCQSTIAIGTNRIWGSWEIIFMKALVKGIQVNQNY